MSEYLMMIKKGKFFLALYLDKIITNKLLNRK